MIRRLALAAATALVAFAAHAEDMPRQLSPELIRTEHEYCKTSTGYGQKFTLLVDVDGDGRKDVVLDYAEALCGGQPDPYCTDQGCLLKVWTATGGTYRKAFEGRVKTWKIDTVGGRPLLVLDGRPLGS